MYLPGMLVVHRSRGVRLRVGRVVESPHFPDTWLEGYCERERTLEGFWAREGVILSADPATAGCLRALEKSR